MAIILTSAILLVRKDKSGSKVAQQEIPAAVMEADVYYASQVDARYNEIRDFDFSDEEEKAVLLDELSDLDKLWELCFTHPEWSALVPKIMETMIPGTYKYALWKPVSNEEIEARL